MKSSVSTLGVHDTLRDFTADPRLLVLSAMAIATGSFGAWAAWVLLKLIALVTNFAYFHHWSTATTYLSHAKLGPGSILIPIIGGLIVGLMARYGSPKIRGHGIPEALEAILIGQSRIEPKVALLKPLSSAIAIGTGGPFGAEGPDHHDGRSARVAVRAVLPSELRGAQDTVGCRRSRRHDGDLRHAGCGRAPCHRGDALRVEAAQLRAGGRLRHRRDGLAALAGRRVAALSAHRHSCDAVVGVCGLRRRRRRGRPAIRRHHRRALRHRGVVREAAHPLDVVAGARRHRRRYRRASSIRRPWESATTTSRR